MSLGRVVSRILPATLLTLSLVSCSGSPSDDGWRTIEFETDEVTDPETSERIGEAWLRIRL